ncbi:MAG TPA: response regulator [Chitinophagaceae bacterium]|nr:response regulator [Chitinophagaceae bacterium]
MKRNTIMIADDDEDLLFLLKTHLASVGYIVSSCGNGNAIIEKLTQEKPDVVLLDIEINGMEGDALCRQIKRDKRLTEVKVLIMSGKYDIERISLSCGADGYISKPLSYHIIERKISALFSAQ